MALFCRWYITCIIVPYIWFVNSAICIGLQLLMRQKNSQYSCFSGRSYDHHQGTELIMTVYSKSSHAGSYLNFESNHSPYMARAVVGGLCSWATVICQERRLVQWKCLLSMWRSLLGNLKHRRHGSVTAAVCKTKHTLTSLLIRTLLERNLWQQVQNIFEWISCKFGKSYTGEMDRLLGWWVQEYRCNVFEGLVPQHANEGQWIGWNEARILQIETERYRKNEK